MFSLGDITLLIFTRVSKLQYLLLKACFMKGDFLVNIGGLFFLSKIVCESHLIENPIWTAKLTSSIKNSQAYLLII